MTSTAHPAAPTYTPVVTQTQSLGAVTVGAPGGTQMVQGTPVVFQTQTVRKTYPSYRHKQARVLGVLELIAGGLLITFQIVAFIVNTHTAAAGAASTFISAVLCLIAGSFTLVSSKHKIPCFVISAMILSIISAAFMLTVASPAIAGIVHDSDVCKEHYHNGGYYYDYDYNRYNDYNRHPDYNRYNDVNRTDYNPYNDYDRPEEYDYYPRRYPQPGWWSYECSPKVTKIAISSVLIVVAVAQVVFAVWQSALGCRVTCCGKAQQNVGPVRYHQAVAAPTLAPTQVVIAGGAANMAASHAPPPQYVLAPPNQPTVQYLPPSQAVVTQNSGPSTDPLPEKSADA